uniref:Transthyretin-like family-containing protein n=1 Tax=Strongyloides stercoralis TaxID=6248 RepID=A0A0K0E5H1_STRER
MLKFIWLFYVLFFTGEALFSSLHKKWKIHITGQLFCKGIKVKNAVVEIYDYPLLGSGVMLNRKNSNKNGEFNMLGKVSKFLPPKPYINIYDHCNVKNTFCYNIRNIYLSIRNCTVGKNKYERIWKLGTIELYKPSFKKNHVYIYSKEHCDSIFQTINQNKNLEIK